MTDRLDRLERHLDEVLAGPRRLMRSLSKHTTGIDAMTATNETAYPVTSKNDYNEVGLTKREHFAAMAMQGLCTHVAPNYTAGECNAAIVERAVILADALIAELNKETP